jgi:hypothetical protein
MSEISVPASLPRFVKPKLDTPFHIDHGWWERENRDLTVEVQSHLCPAHREVFADHWDVEQIDWVDLRTGEVRQVNGVEHVLRVHCSKEPGYITPGLTLVEAVFRVFLANGNEPATCIELAEVLGRPPEKILRTLAGHRVYKGIRPVA